MKYINCFWTLWGAGIDVVQAVTLAATGGEDWRHDKIIAAASAAVKDVTAVKIFLVYLILYIM